jgi:hypothetical protein
MAGMSGIIYAPSALLSSSGNSLLQDALDVGMLNLSGNVALTQTADGSDGTGDTSGIANTLLGGDLAVYINDPSGCFTADELERIQDALSAWDAILAPYNVTIAEVSDPTMANMVIDTGTTSACGGMANGVLGCFNEPAGEITLINGWNWYAGADPTQIGAGQYDFETTVLHELGHALGLGGSTNPSSPMYETLASGVADRTVTVADLNIPDPPEGADPQMAAGFSVVPGVTSDNGDATARGTAAELSVAAIGLAPMPSTEHTWTEQPAATGPQWAVFGGPSADVGVEATLVTQGSGGISGRATLPVHEFVDVLPLPGGIECGVEPAVDPQADSERRVNSAQVGRVGEPFANSGTVPDHSATDRALEALDSEWMPWAVTRGLTNGVDGHGDRTVPLEKGAQAPSVKGPVRHTTASERTPEIPTKLPARPLADSRLAVLSSRVQPTDLLLKAGVFAIGASVLTARNLRVGRTEGKRRPFNFGKDSRGSR